jgi:hypothetical protein
MEGGFVSLVCLLVAQTQAQPMEQEWMRGYDRGYGGNEAGTALTVDASGNVTVTGGTDCYYTIKYSSAGVPLWTNLYYGPDGMDVACAVGADADENVIVTGRSAVFNYGFYTYIDNILTIKYSGAGVRLWTNRYAGPDDGFGNVWGSVFAGMVLDSIGNVIVVGSCYHYLARDTFPDGAVIKYSKTGEVLWINDYEGPGSGADGFVGVAVDGEDNIIVTGGTTESDGQYYGITMKYSAAGIPLWTNLSTLTGYLVMVDASGNALVKGEGGMSKYSSAGAVLWTNSCVSGPAAMDSSGNVFVAGCWAGSGTRYDYQTIKYSSAGVALWTNRYNGPANADDLPAAVAVADDGTVIVTGSVNQWDQITAYNDYATVAYSNSGVPLWTNRYNGTANGPDSANALALGPDGSVYVTGGSDVLPHPSIVSWDIATVKYSVLRPVPLLMQRMENQFVLSWTNSAFLLQAGPSVAGPFTNVPAATSPYTNPIAEPQQFFRLRSK